MSVQATPSPGPVDRLRPLLPGLTLAVAIALVGTLVGRGVPLLGSAVPALVIGVLLGLLVRDRSRIAPGTGFTSKRVLQVAVALLGAQLSLDQVASVGLGSLPVMLGTLVLCLLVAWGLGRALGVIGDLRTLIGVGTGICGASAIAATAPILGAASAEVAYAVAVIFLFNVLAVVLFPLVGHLLGMDAEAFGLFAGTAVNDTSSVVAAAGVFGAAATNEAVVVKLVRTLMLVPICVALAVWVARRARAAAGDPDPLTPRRVVALVPWFLAGFVILAGARTLGAIPDAALPTLAGTSGFLITAAMAAIGLATDPAAVRRAGWRPLALGGGLSLTVAGSALALMALTGRL